MNLLRQWKSIITSIVVILVMFVIISVFDIILAVISGRFYSTVAFIVIFGVGGVFAAVFSYSYAIGIASQKNEWARWSIIATIILMGILFFFFLSRLEGGEYEPAFKAFGVMLIPTCLLFYKGKMEL